MSNYDETWTGCYQEGNPWKGILHPDSYAHPGRFSKALAERVVDTMLDEGWVKRGDVVLDPFAGVGCGGVICSSRGLRWVGVELEGRHVALARKNFAPCLRRFELFGDPTPVILQGDSRGIDGLLGYAVDGIIGSPPYAETVRDGGGNEGPGAHGESNRRGREKATSDQEMGDTASQLANLPRGRLDAVLSSPPYGKTELNQTGPAGARAERMRRVGMPESKIAHALSNAMKDHYGVSDGQLCVANGETFWSACRDILSGCRAVLRPGAVSAWVVQAFVRDGAVVDFPGEWARLLSDLGYVVFRKVLASRSTEDRHPSLFGGEEVKTKKTVSMWRRLHEKKNPHLAIDGEVVLFARNGP